MLSLLIRFINRSNSSMYLLTVEVYFKAWNSLTLSHIEFSANLSIMYPHNLYQGIVCVVKPVDLHQWMAFPFKYETTNSVVCSSGVLAASKYCPTCWIQESPSFPSNSGILNFAGLTIGCSLFISKAVFALFLAPRLASYCSSSVPSSSCCRCV